MKKYILLFLITILACNTVFAEICRKDIKRILKNGSTEELRNAMVFGFDMRQDEAICYTARYSSNSEFIKLFVEYGLDLNDKVCNLPKESLPVAPLSVATYYENIVITKAIIKENKSLFGFRYTACKNKDLAEIFIKNASVKTVENAINALEFYKKKLINNNEKQEKINDIESAITNIKLLTKI